MNSITKIKINEIDSFNNHPFIVSKDEELEKLVSSIKDNGLLSPIIVRKVKDRYELISGHRRKLAFEILGLKEIEANVKDLSDDEAILAMVDSNIYREKILPSEKAFAYKMKNNALKHQGKTTSVPKGPKLTTTEIGKFSGDSSTNVKRYIRLTYLIPELLELVDNTVKNENKSFLTMGIKPAVEISYLNKDEQTLLYSSITYADLTPSHAQAIKIKDLSKKKLLDFNQIENILSQKKGNQNEQISFNKEKVQAVLPKELLKRDKRYIEQYIIEAINYYKKVKKEDMKFIF